MKPTTLGSIMRALNEDQGREEERWMAPEVSAIERAAAFDALTNFRSRFLDALQEEVADG